MDADTAIRRLSFVEARSSGSEALMLVAKHRTDIARAAADHRIEAETDALAERARDEARRVVDKTA